MMKGHSVTLTVDTNVGAAYIKLSDQAIAQTVEFNPDIQVDIDATGTVVGVEVLSLTGDFPLEELVSRFKFPTTDVVDVLSQIRPSIGAFNSSVSSGRSQAYVPELQPV